MRLSRDVSQDDVSDEQLVERYRDGRTEAFEALVHRYERELFNFLARFLGKKAAADDVFQETFIQVHISIETFDTSRRFKPWLFTIAANKARDFMRRNKRRATSLSAPVGSVDDSETTFVDLMEDSLPLPTDQAESSEMRERVREVVADLPDHLREILLLAYFHKMPYREVAEALGIPLGTVKSRLHAAVGTFAEAWKQKNEPEET